MKRAITLQTSGVVSTLAIILTVSAVITLASARSANAQITFSGTGLSNLDYSAYPPGVAQYVAAAGTNPAVAALSTPDAGLGPDSGDAAVFAEGPFGTLSQVSMSFDIYSMTGGGGNLPYAELYVVLPDSSLGGIIGLGGPTLNDSSQMHVIDTDQSYFGQTLGSILTNTYEGVAYGDMQVEYIGVGIGDWAIDDSIGATANIDSMTVVPEPTTVTMTVMGGMLLLPLGAKKLRSLRKRRSV